MQPKFRATIVAIGLTFALAMPTFAQSTDTSTPQDAQTNNTIFLPLITSATQTTSAPDAAPLIDEFSTIQAAALIVTNGKLAFSSTVDGDADIYTMNADGSGLVNLTNNDLFGTQQTSPQWSPDGTKIVYTVGGSVANGVTQGYIALMNADGTNATLLTLTNTGGGTDSQPEWSPDGTKLAFSTRREGDFDIYIMNADGTNPRNMFVSEPIDIGQPGESNPSWSPDGTRLLYISTGSLMETNIAVLDAAGVGPQQNLLISFGVEFGEPKWSADGQLIAYIHYGLTPELWVVNADGTNRSQIVLANVINPQSPGFSPDGKLITVVGQPVGTTGASKEIFTIPVPTAPLSTSSTTTVTAARLTTTGGVGNADWQKQEVVTQALNVSITGSGVVTSQPSGIHCGTQCTAQFVSGTKVTLTATPSTRWRFTNWSGACNTKSTTCTVTMDQARSVVANFRKK